MQSPQPFVRDLKSARKEWALDASHSLGRYLLKSLVERSQVHTAYDCRQYHFRLMFVLGKLHCKGFAILGQYLETTPLTA